MLLFIYFPSEVIYMALLVWWPSVNIHQNEFNRFILLSSERVSAVKIRKRALSHDTQGLPLGGIMNLNYQHSSTALWAGELSSHAALCSGGSMLRRALLGGHYLQF